MSYYKRKLRNRHVQAIREWRNSRTRPRAKGTDRAAIWAAKPMGIWPSSGSARFSNGTVSLQIPKRFSMIENPNETIAFLQNLRNVVGSSSVRHIIIDHKTCEHTDCAPRF
jgi:hypothetical protein